MEPLERLQTMPGLQRFSTKEDTDEKNTSVLLAADIGHQQEACALSVAMCTVHQGQGSCLDQKRAAAVLVTGFSAPGEKCAGMGRGVRFSFSRGGKKRSRWCPVVS
jgi:hypothetical protein